MLSRSSVPVYTDLISTSWINFHAFGRHKTESSKSASPLAQKVKALKPKYF